MKHHYIPQFYLRPWEGDDNQLQEFKRGYLNQVTTKRVFTKQTGYAPDLYTLPGATEETKQNVEKAFMALLDNEAVKARDMMLNDQIPADPKTRESWTRFVLSMVFRNPEEMEKFKASFRNEIRKPDPKIRAEYDRLKDPDDPETFEEWLMQNRPERMERSAILTMTNLVQRNNVNYLLRTMHWRVIDVSEVSRRLMTSDRPIMMSNGMVQYGGHFALPISPTKLFLACTAVQFANEFCAMATSKIVRDVNKIVIGQGRKFVYAKDTAQQTDVRQHMGRLPYPSFVRPEPNG
ncbi:DUF4238 domain-containing protein [Rhizobium ruizarguesonis]|uniref:DUF4238 domain-containing protein n=1 Tax=Rhizobium ruizarguesonis TaxID=2081791 RepID=UPI001030D5DB|nr:DUF4238 domain-containing protein [Rhizobium ruizarguesonis]TBA16126.1 DUF4238 domain-containing protein [Rhizobium ruizarguesonis]